MLDNLEFEGINCNGETTIVGNLDHPHDSFISSGSETDDDDQRRAAAKRPTRRRRYKESSIGATRFEEIYTLTGEVLGRGAYATVVTCVNVLTGQEYAAKIIEKRPGHSRIRIIKEIELFHLCAGHPNIVQLLEYFEEDDKFYLIFEKMRGGSLLSHLQRNVCFSENEARDVVRHISNGLKFLHDKGIAHRDLKPENILCTRTDSVCPVKLCDLDLASKIMLHHYHSNSVTTPELQSPVGSAEFMAPEVVDAFVGESLSYDKRCDLWSVGVILYIMLCGYPPFYGECSRSDCGWNKGKPCYECQETLFNRIQIGRFDFPDEDWKDKSDNVKDLIRHLLTRNVNRRYTIDELLHHPFLNPESQQQQPPPQLSRISSKGYIRNSSCGRSELHNDDFSLGNLKISSGGPQTISTADGVGLPIPSRPVWIAVPSDRSKQAWAD